MQLLIFTFEKQKLVFGIRIWLGLNWRLSTKIERIELDWTADRRVSSGYFETFVRRLTLDVFRRLMWQIRRDLSVFNQSSHLWMEGKMWKSLCGKVAAVPYTMVAHPLVLFVLTSEMFPLCCAGLMADILLVQHFFEWTSIDVLGRLMVKF
jgi:hypothetical protein